mgnify:CR=1 FL=1
MSSSSQPKWKHPRNRIKAPPAGGRLLPGATDSEEQLSSYENQLSYYTEKIMKEPG